MTRLIAGASLLLLSSTYCLSAPFSVRCERGGYYFVTFDDETGRVVHESPARIDGENRAIKGRIQNVSQDEIQFGLVVKGVPPSTLVFRRKQGVIDKMSSAEASSVLVNCVPTSLRAVLSKYNEID